MDPIQVTLDNGKVISLQPDATYEHAIAAIVDAYGVPHAGHLTYTLVDRAFIAIHAACKAYKEKQYADGIPFGFGSIMHIPRSRVGNYTTKIKTTHMKSKIFQGDASFVQSSLNKWLAANPKVKIEDKTQSSSDNGTVTLTVMYTLKP